MRKFGFVVGLLFGAMAFAGLSDSGRIVQNTASVSCQGQIGTLSFVLNTSTNTIQFKDISCE